MTALAPPVRLEARPPALRPTRRLYEEALACGTPVVASRNGSVPEVIDDGSTGWIVDTEDEMVAVGASDTNRRGSAGAPRQHSVLPAVRPARSGRAAAVNAE